MHGFVLNELERYLDLHHGLGMWTRVRTTAGVRKTPYVITENYPDDEAMAVVLHAAAETGMELRSFLIAFGSFLAGGLLNVYRPFVDEAWTLLDLLEHTEASIHQAVRLNDAAANPPRLAIERVAPNRVEINYRSPRMLCALATGIVQGLSEHYHEAVRIEDMSCMYSGDATCRIAVTLLTGTQDRS